MQRNSYRVVYSGRSCSKRYFFLMIFFPGRFWVSEDNSNYTCHWILANDNIKLTVYVGVMETRTLWNRAPWYFMVFVAKNNSCNSNKPLFLLLKRSVYTSHLKCKDLSRRKLSVWWHFHYGHSPLVTQVLAKAVCIWAR